MKRVRELFTSSCRREKQNKTIKRKKEKKNGCNKNMIIFCMHGNMVMCINMNSDLRTEKQNKEKKILRE